MEEQLVYGNWIRKKILLILGLCSLGTGALIFVPLGWVYRTSMILLFIIVFASFLFPLYSYLMFSPRGGKFQEKVYNLILDHLGTALNGKIIDIGTGNGVLAVKLAQSFPAVEVTGMDYWGKDWEYSIGVCEQNARIAKVADRVHYEKGDAATLVYPPGTFDGAVSNLTFHEVKSVADKRIVVREALRVLKPGSPFVFVDYFYDETHYGKATVFAAYFRDLNLAQFECVPLHQKMVMPVLLRHPKILGKAGIVYGRV